MINRGFLYHGLVICVLIMSHSGLFAQEPLTDSLFLQKIKAHVDLPGGHSDMDFINTQVQEYCRKDYACLLQTLGEVMYILERQSNLILAIEVGKEMVNMAELNDDLQAQAKTYKNLSRYYQAIGDYRDAFAYLEKALRLFELLNDQPAVFRTRMSFLEYGLETRDVAEVLPEMESLLTQVRQSADSANVTQLILRLAMHSQEAGLYDKMEEYVVALENIPLSNPLQQSQYPIAIHAALGRADLHVHKNNLTLAEQFYHKALRFCQAEPSRWQEINVLQQLSDLEWHRKNAPRALAYLDSAEQKAVALDFDDLLTHNYKRKATIAEAQGRFSDALKYVKLSAFHLEKFESRKEGFTIENYNLQREKEKLASETEIQSLALRLRKFQLTTSLTISVLALAITILLMTGIRRLRKSKDSLTAQNEIIQAQAEDLKSIDVAKSRFFANVSHELRTPLTLILGPVKSVLKSNTLDATNQKLLTQVRLNSESLLKVVGSLLEVSKLEHGKMTLQENPEQVFPLIRRLVSTFESHAQYRNIQLTLHYRAEHSLRLEIDREKLEVILNNLLSNAFKFTDDGGKVDVIVEDKSNIMQIIVRDTGWGIAAQDLPHVFDRFYQSKANDNAIAGGTGIGLALCRELVTLMGGRIGIESTSGVGTSITVELPRKEVMGLQEEMQIIDIADHEKSAVNVMTSDFPMLEVNTLGPTLSLKNESYILVVEDNYSLREYLHQILHTYYQVICARNGREALDFIHAQLQQADPDGSPHLPSLIVSDLMMPLMDGYQLLDSVKSNMSTRHIPFILLTARTDASDRIKALRIGVDDYLTKPFDEDELLARMDNLLRNREVRQVAAKEITELSEAPPDLLTAHDAEWLENFETYIRKNLNNDTMSISTLAPEFMMSESTLLRQLKRLTGLSTVQYIQEIRLDEARHLLETQQYDTIARVASLVGYTEVRSFSRVFKQRFGKSPSDYAKS